MTTEVTAPAYPRATPRHSITMRQDLWDQLGELAAIKLGVHNSSEMLRVLAERAIAEARTDGTFKVPKQRRRS